MMAKSIAGHTLQCLCFQDLTARLVLKLIVFTQVVVAKGTLEDAATVFPDIALALNACRILQGARAGVRRQALSSMAHPGLTVVANGTHHGESRGELSGVLDHTVAGLHHALHFTALGAHW